jgi:hypothetical protein
MNLTDFVKRADELIADADRVISTHREGTYGGSWVDRELWAAFRSAGLSFLRSTFGEQHPYYSEFAAKVTDADKYDTASGKGILIAARGEVAGGWVATATGIVSAQIFSDFLEMAEYLHSEGYKDPAAVMTGSVLEEHLRQVARKHGVQVETVMNGKATPKKADVLNADLVKAGVYGKLEQKLVTAWLDLRNKSAHGHYGDYTDGQVQLMMQGVTQFMVQVSV